jgi:hypothetical protein
MVQTMLEIESVEQLEEYHYLKKAAQSAAAVWLHAVRVEPPGAHSSATMDQNLGLAAVRCAPDLTLQVVFPSFAHREVRPNGLVGHFEVDEAQPKGGMVKHAVQPGERVQRLHLRANFHRLRTAANADGIRLLLGDQVLLL